MDRTYAANTNKQVEFFFGLEIENTKFKGLKTLFIVGNKSLVDILDRCEQVRTRHGHSVEHLYFAANHSYDQFTQFEQLLNFIQLGFKVTYETTNTRITKDLLSKLPLEHKDFVFMVSVVLPNIDKMLTSAVIKIDDVDVNRNNPGVWCHPLTDLVIANSQVEVTKKFTPWIDYGGDIILD